VLELDYQGTPLAARIVGTLNPPWRTWMNQVLKVRGIVAAQNNGRGRKLLTVLIVDGAKNVQVVSSAAAPSVTRNVPLDGLLAHDSVLTSGIFICSSGEVTAATPDGSWWLQQRREGVSVRFREPLSLRPGQQVPFCGQLQREADGSPSIRRAWLEGAAPEIAPLQPILLPQKEFRKDQYLHSLVAIEAEVSEVENGARGASLYLSMDKSILSVPLNTAELARLANSIQPGDRVRVAGLLEGETESLGLRTLRTLIPRRKDDVSVLARLPLWKRLPWLTIGITVGIVMTLALIWIRQLRSRVKEQTAALWLQTDELIRRSEELENARNFAEEASSAQARFLATVSHELRTPLNGMIGFTELLLDGELKPQQREYANTVHSSGELLLRLLNDVLDLSRIESGRMELESIPFAPSPVFQQTLELLRPRAMQKNLELTLQLPPELPPFLMGDPTRLGQILMNLVSNAIKFTSEGFVKVQCAWEPAGALRIVVTDSGIGIPADAIGRLFQPFMQADSSTSRRFGGTGLGLAICRELAELTGGSIVCESQPGKGSSFQVVLPIPAAEAPTGLAPLAQQLQAAIANPVKAEQFSVLLVEDNAVNQKLASILLERLGCQVTVAVDGSEAVSWAQKQWFDVIFMDCHMPVMDGHEATRHIRAEEGPSRNAPIVALTASAAEEDRRLCEAVGMDDFLTKPIRREELTVCLHRWATHERVA
jgi:signal transduction histidine kinase/CheY-like chemotaxis protein